MPRRFAWEPPPFEWSQLGPVVVELQPEIVEDDVPLAGCAYIQERRLALDSTLEEMPLRVVLWHELLHLWLHDAGIHGLHRDVEEAVVQALATALVARETFHAVGAPRERGPTAGPIRPALSSRE